MSAACCSAPRWKEAKTHRLAQSRCRRADETRGPPRGGPMDVMGQRVQPRLCWMRLRTHDPLPMPTRVNAPPGQNWSCACVAYIMNADPPLGPTAANVGHVPPPLSPPPHPPHVPTQDRSRHPPTPIHPGAPPSSSSSFGGKSIRLAHPPVHLPPPPPLPPPPTLRRCSHPHKHASPFPLPTHPPTHPPASSSPSFSYLYTPPPPFLPPPPLPPTTLGTSTHPPIHPPIYPPPQTSRAKD